MEHIPNIGVRDPTLNQYSWRPTEHYDVLVRKCETDKQCSNKSCVRSLVYLE